MHFYINISKQKKKKSATRKNKTAKYKLLLRVIPLCMRRFHSISMDSSFRCPLEGITTHPLGCCGCSDQYLHEAPSWSGLAYSVSSQFLFYKVNLLSGCVFVCVRVSVHESKCAHACKLTACEHQTESPARFRRSPIFLEESRRYYDLRLKLQFILSL